VSKLLIYMWQIHRLSEAAVIVILMKGLLLNTWYVLVDVLIAVRLHYRLSEAAVKIHKFMNNHNRFRQSIVNLIGK
jgi:hypothetical protein